MYAIHLELVGELIVGIVIVSVKMHQNRCLSETDINGCLCYPSDIY